MICPRPSTSLITASLKRDKVGKQITALCALKPFPPPPDHCVLGASAHYNWMFGMPVARGRRSQLFPTRARLAGLKIWHNGQRSPVAARRILHRRRRNWPLPNEGYSDYARPERSSFAAHAAHGYVKNRCSTHPACVLRCGPGRWWHRDFRTRPARGDRVSDVRMVGRL